MFSRRKLKPGMKSIRFNEHLHYSPHCLPFPFLSFGWGMFYSCFSFYSGCVHFSEFWSWKVEQKSGKIRRRQLNLWTLLLDFILGCIHHGDPCRGQIGVLVRGVIIWNTDMEVIIISAGLRESVYLSQRKDFLLAWQHFTYCKSIALLLFLLLFIF